MHLVDIPRQNAYNNVVSGGSIWIIVQYMKYLKNGILEWEGDKNKVITAGNRNLIDFVYSSELFKELRDYFLQTDKTSITNVTTKVKENEKNN